MPTDARHFATAAAVAAGGLLTAMSSSFGTAAADVWTITDAGGVPPEVISVSGMPPFDQTVLEQGTFGITHLFPNGGFSEFIPSGVLSVTQSFGFTNEDFVSNYSGYVVFPDHSVVAVMSLGGYENIYVDLPGLGAGGANEITDTLVTPFGNFDIPITFDAVAPAAAADWTALLDPSGFAAALDADWTTLVADFTALF
jgi:hypothetical protein